ncbi:methylglutaconyl-CoA hydratase, mitochondrial-like [Chelonus insularis]|uniref:methylglutaconyl-CoA hydratase, mitochondrial-like n=1 Tax=Chelonus insularis TaxID=460826 RepID=UPI00158D8B05|nr:methylglutaconyl-CoA hydratase, mitochondrial-like [Chelonus insularis]XP_034935464.1 methylglutaconyl-CoA hydratase, mitochondrial-like [Chelonus insularis]
MVGLISRLKTKQMVHDCLSIVKRMSTRALRDPEDKVREVRLSYLDGKDNGIAVLSLNRPEAKNALSKNMVAELLKAVSIIHQDEKIRVLIVRSLVPKIFCAGADLRERFQMSEDDIRQYILSLRSFMNDLELVPAPVISAIDGAALGGGLELALATDIRTAVSEAKMGLVETKWAIIPGAGGTQRLPRVIGPAKAKELIYTAKIIDANEAKEIGLINQVVPQNKIGDAAYQSALEIARQILPNGPIGVKMAKVAISKGIEMPIEGGFQIEKKCYEQLLHTKDRIEGLAAFSAKRIPIYQGI